MTIIRRITHGDWFVPALGIVPLVVLLLFVTFVQIPGGFSADSNYPFFLNALNLLNLHTVKLMDHPGTPVFIIGAIVLGVVWLLRAPLVGFYLPEYDILLHSELYLYCVSTVFALMSAGAIYFLGFRLHRATRSFAVAAVGQASILIAYPILMTLPQATPESLLIFLSVLLMAALVPMLFPAETFVETRDYSLFVGAIIGVCIATKITAAPFIFAVFFLQTKKSQIYAVGASALAFVISTLPGYPLYPAMAKYFFELFVHTGHNGSGGIGIPPFANIFSNFSSLLAPGASAIIAILFCCMFFVLRAGTYSRGGGDFTRLFQISGLIIVVQIIMVTKAPQFRYLGPSCVMACLVNAGVMHLAMLQNRPWRYWSVSALLVVLALIFGETTRLTYLWYRQTFEIARGVQSLLVKAEASGCNVIPYYESPALGYKLLFGKGPIALYDQTLSKLFPNFLSYNVWQHQFQSFTGDLDPRTVIQRLQDQKCVYLLGSEIGRFQEQGFIADKYLSLVDRNYPPVGVFTAIYKLQFPPNTAWSDLVPSKK
jgi:hypothetical protein